jgi:hypothetical protein
MLGVTLAGSLDGSLEGPLCRFPREPGARPCPSGGLRVSLRAYGGGPVLRPHRWSRSPRRRRTRRTYCSGSCFPTLAVAMSAWSSTRAARPATKNSPPTPSKLSIREWSAYRGSCLRSRTFGEVGHIRTSIRPAANPRLHRVNPGRAIGTNGRQERYPTLETISPEGCQLRGRAFDSSQFTEREHSLDPQMTLWSETLRSPQTPPFPRATRRLCPRAPRSLLPDLAPLEEPRVRWGATGEGSGSRDLEAGARRVGRPDR